MFILIENGEVFDPAPLGRQSLLTANSSIEMIGAVDRRALDAARFEYEVIDATGCVVVPGFIDPHEHLLGKSGEGGFAQQSPMLFLREIVQAGITTVVGVLGVDTTMKTVSGLLARVKALDDEGLTTRMWTGGYNVPPTTVMNSIRDDMLFIDEVVGAGEVAISDDRGLNQSGQELAKLVRDTHVGGLLTAKSGVTHFHVGEDETRLQPLRDIIEEYQVKAEWLYPTHVARSEQLLREAIELAHEGAYVDIDVVDRNLAKWLGLFIEHGGPLDRLTISSDADSSTPLIYFEQFRNLVIEHGYDLDQVLPLVTVNPATVLKLGNKGVLETGKEADVVILDRSTLEIRHVIARGRKMVSDGELAVEEHFLGDSSRNLSLVGQKWPDGE
jgi:beta-aspartyl-dipeptidase (metallo-type)